MIETVIRLLPREPYVNVAVLSDNAELLRAVQNAVAACQGRCADLRDYNLAQLPFGGEYFEAIIVDRDGVLEDERTLLQMKRAIQKNRSIILLSAQEERWSLAERLEAYGFSDFSTIKEGGINITLFKKWFTFET